MDPKQKHLIVISVDAMVWEDLAYAKTLPNFGKVLTEGSRVNRVKTIYPSLTHPVHATLLTGCGPGKTGVVSNELFCPGELVLPWYNELSQIQVPTIFHLAHEAGLTTAASRWPVTAKGEDVIDYLIPEVMGTDIEGKEESEFAAVYQSLGSGRVMDIVTPRLSILHRNDHPYYEEFAVQCSAEIIRRYQPNLLFTHLCMVDTMRHRTGLFNERIYEALDITDRWVGMLFDAVKDAGIEESTDFVILSDHGHLDIRRNICLNAILAEKGYLTVGKDNRLLDWKIYVKGCGLSAQVYVKDKKDEEEAARLLASMAEDGIYGISEVLSAREAKRRYGLYGDFSFVLESDGMTSINDEWVRPFVRPCDIQDYRYGATTHGHMPEKGPQPPFLAMGPSFQKGVVLEEGSILDEAPTFAKVFSLTMPQAEGKPMEALLSKD